MAAGARRGKRAGAEPAGFRHVVPGLRLGHRGGPEQNPGGPRGGMQFRRRPGADRLRPAAHRTGVSRRDDPLVGLPARRWADGGGRGVAAAALAPAGDDLSHPQRDDAPIFPLLGIFHPPAAGGRHLSLLAQFSLVAGCARVRRAGHPAQGLARSGRGLAGHGNPGGRGGAERFRLQYGQPAGGQYPSIFRHRRHARHAGAAGKDPGIPGSRPGAGHAGELLQPAAHQGAPQGAGDSPRGATFPPIRSSREMCCWPAPERWWRWTEWSWRATAGWTNRP